MEGYHGPGRDTSEAIANGALVSVIGAIERIAQDLSKDSTWRNMRWILTGGNSGKLSNMLTIEFEQVDELMMDGLELMAHAVVEKGEE